jgi:enoyl-CoA hydratase/carnithine racemase
MPYVLYEVQDQVAVITLNRPERMNALGSELNAELRDAEARFAADDEARIGIYIGAGDRAFCAGRDLKEVVSGEPVDAQDAYRMGLVTRVVPQADLLNTARQMATTIAGNAPLAISATRKLATLGLELPQDYARRMGASLVASVWGSEDAVEGAKAFAEKRPPQWQSR